MFNKIKSFFTKASEQISQLAGSSITGMNSYLFPNTVGINYYKDWVYRAVTARARRVSEIEFEVYKGTEKIENHEILLLLADVDYEAISSFLDLTGNAFLYVERFTKGNKPSKLYLLHPNLVKPVLNQNNMLELAYYQVGQNLKVPPEDIIHFKNFNPKQNFPYEGLGVSVIECISSSILSDESARRWNYNFFLNSARPDGFLTTEQKLSKEEIEQVRENFMSKYGGLDNAHKIGLLTRGMDFKQLSLSQKDIDFVMQSNMTQDEILSSFGVPKSEIGLVTDVNRANAEASTYVFAKNTIEPIMRKITKALAKKLLPSYEVGLELYHKSIVPEDRTQMLAEWTAGVDKWFTRNEIRREYGLPEIEGGDTLFGGLAQIPIATVPKKAVQVEEKPDFKGLISAIKSMNIDAHLKGWDAIFKASEPKFIKDIKEYFNKQEAFVVSALKKIDKAFTLNQVRDVLTSAEWDTQVELGISFLTPRIREYILQGAENGQDLFDNVDFDEETDAVQSFIVSRAKFTSESVNQTTRDALLSSIGEGIDNNENLQDIIGRVKSIYTEATDNRAKMIARTEISASANFGKQELYKQAGVEYITWQVVDPQDEDCKMNEGVEVKLGEAFPSGDTNSPIHPNCQCTTLPVEA